MAFLELSIPPSTSILFLSFVSRFCADGDEPGGTEGTEGTAGRAGGETAERTHVCVLSARSAVPEISRFETGLTVTDRVLTPRPGRPGG